MSTRRRLAWSLGFGLLFHAAAGWSAIPIQPITGPLAGCSPPGQGPCAPLPGLWLGTAGDDTVQVWVSQDQARVERVRIAVHNTACVVSRRYEFKQSWSPGKAIGGSAMPDCQVSESAACSAPTTCGYTLSIAFRSSSCALVEFTLSDPAGGSWCPSPCYALDDIGVATGSRPWSLLKQLYR